MSLELALRDKSQSPEFTVGIDAKQTFVDKRSRPNLQRMTRSGSRSGAILRVAATLTLQFEDFPF
jgi:hypothetical protein